MVSLDLHILEGFLFFPGMRKWCEFWEWNSVAPGHVSHCCLAQNRLLQDHIVVGSDWSFKKWCGSHYQSHSSLWMSCAQGFETPSVAADTDSCRSTLARTYHSIQSTASLFRCQRDSKNFVSDKVLWCFSSFQLSSENRSNIIILFSAWFFFTKRMPFIFRHANGYYKLL